MMRDYQCFRRTTPIARGGSRHLPCEEVAPCCEFPIKECPVPFGVRLHAGYRHCQAAIHPKVFIPPPRFIRWRAPWYLCFEAQELLWIVTLGVEVVSSEEDPVQVIEILVCS